MIQVTLTWLIDTKCASINKKRRQETERKKISWLHKNEKSVVTCIRRVRLVFDFTSDYLSQIKKTKELTIRERNEFHSFLIFLVYSISTVIESKFNNNEETKRKKSIKLTINELLSFSLTLYYNSLFYFTASFVFQVIVLADLSV